MQNPNAMLSDVDPDPDPSKKYHLVLREKRKEKVREANNKSFEYNKENEVDVYDELLTQDEIQLAAKQ